MSLATELDEDFGTRPRQEVVIERLVHGESRRDIARDLKVPLTDVHRDVAQAVREWSGAAGTLRERLVLLHWSLDDLTDLVYRELSDASGADVPALSSVLIDVHKLRAALISAERRSRTTGDDS